MRDCLARAPRPDVKKTGWLCFPEAALEKKRWEPKHNQQQGTDGAAAAAAKEEVGAKAKAKKEENETEQKLIETQEEQKRKADSKAKPS